MRKASLSSCLTFLFAAHNCARSASLPPLLYRTRTLLSEAKIARPFPAAKSHVNSHDRRRRNFCTTPQVHVSADKARRNDPIAFVDTPYDQNPDADSLLEPRRWESPSRLSTSRVKLQNEQLSRPSTVTASEQAAFDRLIKDFSEPTSDEPDGEDILDEGELDSAYDPNVDLDSIFEDAIKQLRLQAEQAATNLISGRVSQDRAIDIRLPDGKEVLGARLFRRPLLLANGKPWVNEPQTDDERTRLEVACANHSTKVTDMLFNAKSDKEIWQVLETEVFSLVVRLNEHIRLLERADNIRARKARRAKADGKGIADIELEEGKEGNPDQEKIPTTNSFMPKEIPVNELLLILQRNYTVYCLVALRLFRKRHPTSLYAQHILSTIRQRGPISYVLGVSVDIYNEALFLQWTQFSDLHGLADLIEEMLNQGIEGNEVTIALIKGIAVQRRRIRHKARYLLAWKWWHMRGTVEGWRRVLNLFERITTQLAKREAMRADEAKSEEEVPQTDTE